jgi:hypothetical protein
MNHIFNKQLRKFLLVLFDDLLIYNRTWEEHLRHVDEILNIMEEQSLFSEEANCKFRMTKILYQGHVIGVEGVKVHQEKIHAILDWPTPRSLTDLRGFFGLRNYYSRFEKGFLQLPVPLKDLTEKGAFRWSEEAHEAFDMMKKVISTCPVLALPDFSQPFVLECDALRERIGIVLMQD